MVSNSFSFLSVAIFLIAPAYVRKGLHSKLQNLLQRTIWPILKPHYNQYIAPTVNRILGKSSSKKTLPVTHTESSPQPKEPEQTHPSEPEKPEQTQPSEPEQQEQTDVPPALQFPEQPVDSTTSGIMEPTSTDQSP